jgi:hypothetical protein
VVGVSDGPAGRSVQQCARGGAPRLATRVSNGDVATLTRATLESFGCHAGGLGEPDAPEAVGRRRNEAPEAPTTPPTGSRAGGSPVGGREGFECCTGRPDSPPASAGWREVAAAMDATEGQSHE